MPLSYDLNTLRSLQGKIQAIRCFIAQLLDKYWSFNDLLKKGIQFEWEEDYHKEFDDIKKYLLNPLIFIPPKEGVMFYMYLSSMNFTLGVMLA